MGSPANSAGGKSHAQFAVALLLLLLPVEAKAQFFNLNPVRPPADIPGATPPQSVVTPPDAPAAAPKGPLLQSLPPPAATARPQSGPATPSGLAALAVTARFGRDLPAINGGLHWRVYPSKPESTGAFRLI